MPLQILLPAGVLPLPFFKVCFPLGFYHCHFIEASTLSFLVPLNFASRCGFTITISLRHCIHRLLYPALYFIGHLKFCSSLGFYHCHSLRHDIHHLLYLSFYLSWSGPAQGWGQWVPRAGAFSFCAIAIDIKVAQTNENGHPILFPMAQQILFISLFP